MPFFYFTSYLAESLILLVFCENVLVRKTEPEYSKLRVPLLYAGTFIISFALSFTKVPMLNLYTFIIMTFIVVFSGYYVKLLKAVCISIMLTVFMFLTELTVLFLSTSVFKTELYAYANNDLVMVIQSQLSKLLYFLVVYIVMKLFFTEKVTDRNDRFLIFLAILPVATVFVFIFIMLFCESHALKEPFITGLAVGTILLLIANITVFFVYSLIGKANTQIFELTLEKQKEKSTREYYELLLAKQENYSVLVHDIKRHLGAISGLAIQHEDEEILEYIKNIGEDFGIDGSVHYSGNRFIDVIIKRYSDLCREKGISFTADTIFTITSENNGYYITPLIDNMLENAVDSAVLCKKPYIIFAITKENENYISISVKNSCENEPVFRGNIPQTSKKGKNHGTGTKSMKRSAIKLGGNITWKYNSEKKEFITEAIFMNK